MNTTLTRSPRSLALREIMVLESDDDRRARLSRLFHRAGARVTAVAQSDEAVQLACLGVYEVVLIGDIPGEEGTVIARSIKGLSPWTLTVQLPAGDERETPGAQDDGTDAQPGPPLPEEGIVEVVRGLLSRSPTMAYRPQ